jgi:tRNA modification GTPase
MGNTDSAQSAIRLILKYADLGRHLVSPWKVVVAGPPNAGKSSLVNALAGFQRSIVTPIPGTTRDAVSILLAIDGWPVELIDTAGIHPSASGLEQEGVSLAREEIGCCDLCLWVMEVTVPPVPVSLDASGKGIPFLLVANKIDQPACWSTEACCQISALTGQGLTGLCQQVSRKLVPETPAASAAVPFCSEIIAALQEVDQAIAGGKIASALETCNSWL